MICWGVLRGVIIQGVICVKKDELWNARWCLVAFFLPIKMPLTLVIITKRVIMV